MSAITKEGGDGGEGRGVRFVFGEEEEVWTEMGRNLQIASHFIVIALVSWLEHPLLRLRRADKYCDWELYRVTCWHPN